MERCKTCKHWTDPDRSGGDSYAIDLCRPMDPDTWEPMQRGFEARMCKLPGQAFAEAPVARDSFALVDGSEYYAVLVTAEDFGCIRHEAQTACVSAKTPG